MPDGCLSFGVMSTPGACADLLRTEVVQAVLPREPDAVCVMAPSNNLTASRTIEEAGDAFERSLRAVCSCWPKTKFQQEYHRRSAKLNVPFCPIDDHFPRSRTELWCRDGIHLSDDFGMPILTRLMWFAAYQFVETPAPKPLVQSQVSRPSTPRIVPWKVVKRVERTPSPPPPPSEWTVVGSGRKVRGFSLSFIL